MESQRYTTVAIVLHWLIALSIIGLIIVGLWMSNAAEGLSDMAPAERRAFAPQLQTIFQLHKSLGLTVLALTLVRIVWRLTHRPPPLPAMPGWQKAAALATHFGFYVLMLALPLSGWAYVSSGYNEEGEAFPVVTMWFGLFEVPHIPFIAEASDAARIAIAETAYEAHELLAYGAIALILLHVGAALKHQFFDRDGTLSRMLPMAKRDTP